MSNRVIVVGGGLSGLCCCHRMLNMHPALEIILLEAKDNIGGRLHTDNGVDLGAAWIWPAHDIELLELTTRLGLKLLPELKDGTSLIQNSNGDTSVYQKNLSPSGENSFRFQHGASSIINGLAEQVLNNRVSLLLGCEVYSVIQTSHNGLNEVQVTYIDKNDDVKIEIARAIVLAMPPQLIANNISFSPPLSASKVLHMSNTTTWMSNAGKVAFFYDTKFWKTTEKKLSGVVFSQCGPLRQIWDNSNTDGSIIALAGFVFDEDLHYVYELENLISQMEGNVIGSEFILSSPLTLQLIRIFGEGAKDFTRISCKSWAHDRYTSVGDITTDVAGSNKILNSCIPRHKSILHGIQKENDGNDITATGGFDASLGISSNAKKTVSAGASANTANSSFLGNKRVVPFGHKLVRDRQLEGLSCVFFCGTETAPNEHGHMNGAVVAGRRAADEVIDKLTSS